MALRVFTQSAGIVRLVSVSHRPLDCATNTLIYRSPYGRPVPLLRVGA
jgi:hypothetical protein